MVIDLKRTTEERLRALAESTGRSVSEIVETAVERALEEQRPAQEVTEWTPEKKAVFLADIERIRDIADAELPDDGFSGRDHDNVIYRMDW